MSVSLCRCGHVAAMTCRVSDSRYTFTSCSDTRLVHLRRRVRECSRTVVNRHSQTLPEAAIVHNTLG